MSEFDKKKFGNKLREYRIKKGLSLRYVSKVIGKNVSTVSRYETGELIPNAQTIEKLCKALDIYSDDLYVEDKNHIINKENSKNIFKVDRLYLYYKGYVGKKKIGKFKFIIDLKENIDYIEVKISDYKTRKTILIGNMLCDDNIASLRTENYKPNCPRLETNQIIINVSEGTDNILLGVMFCTNGNYIPNVKKCLISKKDLTFTDDMMNMLKCSDEEKENFSKNDIWLADIEQNQEYEYKEE